MGMRRIGLLMEDKQFQNALTTSLAQNMSGYMFIEEQGEEDLDAVITEGKYVDEYSSSSSAILIKLESEPEKYDIDKMTLFKYQGSKSLTDDLLFIFSKSKMTNFSLLNRGNENIIGFFSHFGGEGVTSIALNVCHILGAKNKNVLYLNLEAINSSNRYLEYSNKETDKLLLYTIEEGLETNISRFIHNEGVHEYLDVGIINGLAWSNKGLVNKLLKVIQSTCDYDYLVLDLGVYYEELAAFNEMPIKLFLVSSSVSNTSDSSIEIIQNKLALEANPTEKLFIHIDTDAFCKEGNKDKINYYSAFSGEVRKIVEHIISSGEENE